MHTMSMSMIQCKWKEDRKEWTMKSDDGIRERLSLSLSNVLSPLPLTFRQSLLFPDFVSLQKSERKIWRWTEWKFEGWNKMNGMRERMCIRWMDGKRGESGFQKRSRSVYGTLLYMNLWSLLTVSQSDRSLCSSSFARSLSELLACSLRELTLLAPFPSVSSHRDFSGLGCFSSVCSSSSYSTTRIEHTQLVKSLSEPFNRSSLLWVVFLTFPFHSFSHHSNCSSDHTTFTTFLKICPRAKNEGKSYKKQFPWRLQQEEVICSSSLPFS